MNAPLFKKKRNALLMHMYSRKNEYALCCNEKKLEQKLMHMYSRKNKYALCNENKLLINQNKN